MLTRFLLLALFVFTAGSARAQTIAIRAGNLVDPSKGTVAKDQTILVKSGKIVEVGANVEIPRDAEIMDLSKSWVMPGLMDVHNHVTEGQRNWELELSYLYEDSAYRALRGLKTAQVLLNAGITTVRDVGNDANYAAVDLRKAIEQGWFTGPTILTAGKIIIGHLAGSQTVLPSKWAHTGDSSISMLTGRTKSSRKCRSDDSRLCGLSCHI